MRFLCLYLPLALAVRRARAFQTPPPSSSSVLLPAAKKVGAPAPRGGGGGASSVVPGGLGLAAAARSASSAEIDALGTITDTVSGGPPQIIDVIEPKTGVTVRIVGTMHYNPTSIRQVRTVVTDLGQENALGSVLVESCDVRWNKTMEILSTARGKLLEPVLTSEMKVASETAVEFGRPVVLGDQRIDVTGERLGAEFKATIADLCTPLSGGWQRYYRDAKEAANVALPSGPGYLSPASFFDPRLLIAAPVSFAKYPLSFLARNPLSTSAVFAMLFGLTMLDSQTAADFASASIEEQIGSMAASLAFAGLEVAVLGRIMVRVLLAERNEVIAKNIVEQCKLYSSSSSSALSGGDDDSGSGPASFLSDIMSLFGGPSEQAKKANKESRGVAEEAASYSYLPGSEPTSDSSLSDTADGKGKVVVAVLGMAHANGIVKLLREELV